MTKKDTELLGQILEKLTYLEPGIKKFPVQPVDAKMSVYLLDLKDVCYITTKNKSGRKEIGFVTAKKQYFSNSSLRDIEKRLLDNPHFMRTSKYYRHFGYSFCFFLLIFTMSSLTVVLT